MSSVKPRYGGKPKGFKSYAHVPLIADALAPMVTQLNFTSYPKNRCLKYIQKDRLLAPELHGGLRRLRELSPTWSFLPQAFTDALLKVAKDRRASEIIINVVILLIFRREESKQSLERNIVYP